MSNTVTSSLYDISNIDDLPEEVRASLRHNRKKANAMAIFNTLKPGEAMTIDNYIVAYYRTFKQPVDRIAAMSNLSYYVKQRKLIKKDNLYSLPLEESKELNSIQEDLQKPTKLIKRK